MMVITSVIQNKNHRKELLIIMRFFRRIKAKIYGWEKQPGKAESEQLVSYYRTRFFSNDILKLFTRDDFMNLIHIAHYADTGITTSIKAAFCLGYHSGKGRC